MASPRQLQLQIRPALATDLETVGQIHVRAWQHAYRGQIPDAVLDALDPSERAQKWLAWLGKPGHLLQVAANASGIVGFCSLVQCRDAGANETTGEIAALYVDPSVWRTGAGTALMDAAVLQAHAAGYRVLTLWVLTSNQGAQQFYERVGFAQDGQNKVDTRTGYSLAEVRYRRELVVI